jgi:hypothetical protein
MATGRLPRHLPWADEVMRDPGGQLWLTTALKLERFRALLDLPDSLASLVHAELGATVNGTRGPEGHAVPSWLAHLRVDGTAARGTGHLEYPLKGDPGDLWVSAVARTVMRRDPRWRALLLTMPGVDKIAHLLGEHERPVDLGQDADVHLANACAAADRALGEVLDLLPPGTLVIVTADHGGLAGRFVGDAGPKRANPNWYFGKTENFEERSPSRAIAPLAARPEVAFVMADTMVRVWLRDRSPAAQVRVAAVARALPAAREVWLRGPDRWTRLFRNGPEAAPGSWHARHARPLMDTMNAPHAADLAVLLHDGVSYGARGDHGGHQEAAQRIPLVFHGAGVPREVRQDPARLCDIVPTVRGLLGLGTSPRHDGRPLVVRR